MGKSVVICGSGCKRREMWWSNMPFFSVVSPVQYLFYENGTMYGFVFLVAFRSYQLLANDISHLNDLHLRMLQY